MGSTPSYQSIKIERIIMKKDKQFDAVSMINAGELPTPPKDNTENWIYFKNFWKPFAIFIAGIVIFGFAMFAACAPAKADMNSFLQTLANKGYTGPVSVWQRIGTGICEAQAQGYDTRQIANAIVTHTGAGIYTNDAYEIIAVANQELCINNGAGSPNVRNRVV